MDWYNFLWGIVFILVGIILLLILFSYDEKERDWLDIGNAGLISGAGFGILMGLYFIITSF
ncbi:hypothetical protein ACFSRY_19200 [Pontibacter locisalis]|uniref:Uncharacterized protein n=1 Tax=Pontibacter locisalis TaxID=1719035 RepID=A0ABW5IRN4_9BACT